MYDLNLGTAARPNDDNDNEYDDAIRSARVVAVVVLIDIVLVMAFIAGLVVWLM
jgi:hypothetical protein